MFITIHLFGDNIIIEPWRQWNESTFERESSYFLWFLIFKIVMCIWKVCLFENILIFKINTPTKEYVLHLF